MLIDKYIQRPHFRKLHRIEIRAEPHEVYSAFDRTDFYRSKVIRSLFTIRRLPKNMFSPEGFSKVGIMVLEEKPGEESVLGALFNPIGFRPVSVAPEEFGGFAERGHVKVAMNFLVSKIDEERSLLSTETRVAFTSTKARLVFTPYWLLLNRFIGLVRIMMLRQVREEAESAHQD
jgi:hypothetical protein